MSKLSEAVAFGERMRNQKCTTPGHEDRHAKWLIKRGDSDAQRWVCDECAGKSS